MKNSIVEHSISGTTISVMIISISCVHTLCIAHSFKNSRREEQMRHVPVFLMLTEGTDTMSVRLEFAPSTSNQMNHLARSAIGAVPDQVNNTLLFPF